MKKTLSSKTSSVWGYSWKTIGSIHITRIARIKEVADNTIVTFGFETPKNNDYEPKSIIFSRGSVNEVVYTIINSIITPNVCIFYVNETVDPNTVKNKCFINYTQKSLYTGDGIISQMSYHG